MTRTILLVLFSLISTSSVQAGDVVIYGGTPGGIAAAITAARLGRDVTLVEYHDHIGGMMTSGLGKSDIENRAMIGGLFQEFVARVHTDYVRTYGADHQNVMLCQDGYYSEPHVAERVLETMIAEQPTITVMRGWRLSSAKVEGKKLREIMILNRRTGAEQSLAAKVFIDATYEGDLYAAAGARYRLGRESRDEFGEAHAGVIYFDYQSHQFLAGTTGQSDADLPAYTYRLCLTRDLDNAHRLTEPPPGYNRTAYLGYFDDLKAGRLAGPKVFKPGRGYNPAHFDTLVRALSVTDIPNQKTDVNINPRPLGFPFAEENRGYIEGDDSTRQRIAERHRNLVLGLLWFLQNDAEVPAAHRALANKLHLPKDEFTDNQHFPCQLYVREGRRLAGEYTLTEHDITGKDQAPKHHPDTIAVGEFPIDSFPCRKRQPGDTIVLEGYLGMLDYITRPYEIPYRIMLPEKIDGLIVPVAASTTHVAYSSIRMEPTWMALGQAAGMAAHLAIQNGVEPRHVPAVQLQAALCKQKAVLEVPDQTEQAGNPPFRIEQSVILTSPRDLHFAQSRAALLPGSPPRVLLTTQQIEKRGSHGYRDLFTVETKDGGKSWSPLRPVESLRRKRMPEGHELVIGDACPQWHAATGVLLATGKTFGFDGGVTENRGHERVSYAVYDPGKDEWSGLKLLELPQVDHEGRTILEPNAGCNQRFDLPGGNILLPIRYRKNPQTREYTTIVARCTFDGSALRYLEHGSELTIPRQRGLYEPSVTGFGGRYFLTMRADHSAFVARSQDGLNYEPIQEWRFDDGQVLGSYNTQQHWIVHNDALYLAYTRRGAQNDHVFRHRAPLFIARVDPDRLCVFRDTEQVLMPETGLDLGGGFGVVDVGPNETWVTSSEMAFPAARQDEPNRVRLANILWNQTGDFSAAGTRE